MRNYYQTITIACCMAMSASPLAIWAQSGDEQGLEIPRNLQLQQDKDELRKAYDGWWTASQKNKERGITKPNSVASSIGALTPYPRVFGKTRCRAAIPNT